eukprot:TRINITY_DN445_c0_g1_i2.p1 TRINITY_DN445_c0_g1~~TRINITY_DN445_c0_g1_i2.p1  ORF type:complete len:468 (-),score=121.68 TRINITY_DN445_c0_g1_i2:224-1627(-)
MCIRDRYQRRVHGNDYLQRLLQNEIDALAKLNSPYIVRFIALKITKNNIYVVTEFCEGGDLLKRISKGRLSEEEVIDILEQICEAFKEMKKLNLIHRDLKPANILVHKGKIKLADLGFAKTVSNFHSSLNISTVGSPIYMSPQVLLRQYYSSKCDIWSLGVILYQLLYRKVPWVGLDMNMLANLIMTKPLEFKRDVPVSREMIDLITRCLKFHENERVSWDDVFTHPVLLRQHLVSKPPAAPQSQTAPVPAPAPVSAPAQVQAQAQAQTAPTQAQQVAPQTTQNQMVAAYILQQQQNLQPGQVNFNSQKALQNQGYITQTYTNNAPLSNITNRSPNVILAQNEAYGFQKNLPHTSGFQAYYQTPTIIGAPTFQKQSSSPLDSNIARGELGGAKTPNAVGGAPTSWYQSGQLYGLNPYPYTVYQNQVYGYPSSHGTSTNTSNTVTPTNNVVPPTQQPSVPQLQSQKTM